MTLRERLGHYQRLLRLDRPIGILLDLQGPKLRIGRFHEDAVMLKKGAEFVLDADPTPGDVHRVHLPHPEILGALAHLRNVCGAEDAGQWRSRMGNLIETEARSAARKAKLAGAYNRGFRGYEISHRACTPGARNAIARFMDEGEKLTRSIADRYSAS